MSNIDIYSDNYENGGPENPYKCHTVITKSRFRLPPETQPCGIKTGSTVQTPMESDLFFFFYCVQQRFVMAVLEE